MLRGQAWTRLGCRLWSLRGHRGRPSWNSPGNPGGRLRVLADPGLSSMCLSAAVGATAMQVFVLCGETRRNAGACTRHGQAVYRA